jgi:histidine kinase-like protein
MGSVRDLTLGGCGAWPLPGDLSSAATARRVYQEAAAEVGIGADLAYDGVTMASELAANTLHSASQDRAAAGPRAQVRSELWLYLRGSGSRRELVCKVFDTCPGWKSGRAPSPFPLPVAPDATGGRGLQVVHELSGGRWGHHLTRARLGRWKVRGKAVWFALPAPPAAGPWPAGMDGLTARDGGLATMQQCSQLSARQATEKLQAMLSARGLGPRLVSTGPAATDLSVLLVTRGLTVFCRGGSVLIETATGDRQHYTYADLEDVTERAVWMHEELDRAAELR